MRPTAFKLSPTALTLDWSCLQMARENPQQEAEFQAAWDTFTKKYLSTSPQDQANPAGFYHCPDQETYSHLKECQQLYQKALSLHVTDCLILGIGGSLLGPVSLIEALSLTTQNNRIQMHFLDNPDPISWHQTLQRVKPQTTLVLCISKSGGTFETLSLSLLALQWLGPLYQKTHFFCITDPHKGDLRSFCEQNQIPSVGIPATIGGRFSIFSSVGILPGLIAGLDMESFLQGAKLLKDFMEKTPLHRNPIFLLAQHFVNKGAKQHIHVCMPYTSPLKSLANWFVQLWAESLGKDARGFTPIAALGAVDQHSLLQLLSDGPNDKIINFITLDQFPVTYHVPSPTEALASFSKKNYSTFNLLSGVSLAELLDIEYRSTVSALFKQNKPSYSIRLDRLDEKSLGSLYFFYALLTTLTGVFWDVNPFDQPGVEQTKRNIQEALSQRHA
jgi:glucose-6-phosphate isomerase